MNTETKMWLAVIVLILAFEKAGSDIIDGCITGGVETCKDSVGKFIYFNNTICCEDKRIKIFRMDDLCECISRSGGGINRLISITRRTNTAQQPKTVSLEPPSDSYTFRPTNTAQQPTTVSLEPSSDSYTFRPTNTAQQPTNLFLVPWFLGLFLWSFGALIQKIALDIPHQL